MGEVNHGSREAQIAQAIEASTIESRKKFERSVDLFQKEANGVSEVERTDLLSSLTYPIHDLFGNFQYMVAVELLAKQVENGVISADEKKSVLMSAVSRDLFGQLGRYIQDLPGNEAVGFIKQQYKDSSEVLRMVLEEYGQQVKSEVESMNEKLSNLKLAQDAIHAELGS
jgi:hypothetical protein